jgi:Trk-type K+ transport system membrane component
VTLVGTAVLVVGAAAVVFFTESTERWQLRNPRPDTPGRLMVAEPAEGEMIVFSGESASAAQQRMRTMAPGRRLAAAAFHGVSARAGGFRVARLDEKSLSPAGRAVLMGLMLVGGGLGGTAGGLSITVVLVLLGTMQVGKNAGESRGDDIPEGGRDARPPELRDARPPELLDASFPATREDRLLMVRAAAGAVMGLGLVIGITALVLIYREPASVELCWFTAVSAGTNSGLAIGPTRLLSPEAQAVVVLAMILGRVIPLAMLGKHLRSCALARVENAQSLPHS